MNSCTINAIKNAFKKMALWVNMLFVLALFVVVLFSIEVPHILRELDAHVANRALDEMRYPLFKIKAVSTRFEIDKDVSSARSGLEKLDIVARSRIDNYKNAAAYSIVSSKNVADFTIAYNSWINAEKRYINQFSQTHNVLSPHESVNDHYLSIKAAENNALFFNAIQLLAEGEPAINADLAEGHRAYHILQWASGLFTAYFFIVVFLYQRNLSHKHLIREKNLEMTLRSIGDAVIAADLHGNVTSMNPEAERLTGWSFKEARGCALSKIFRVVNEHSGEPVDDLVEQVKKEDGIVVLAEDSLLIASNGNRYQIYENGAPIYDDAGRIMGVVLVFRDITQEHEIKNCLNEHALRLQRVIDSSMDAVIVTDEQGLITEWNSAAALMFGWSYAEVRNQLIHQLIIPEQFREQHLSAIERIIKSSKSSGCCKRVEALALHREGHTFPVELAMASVPTENGWVFNAFIRDLSEIKNNEKIIQKKEALLGKGQRVAKLGFWELDLISNKLEWSDQIFRIFGLDPATTKPSYDLFINAVHPDDRERVDAVYKESLENKMPYKVIHRIVTRDGIKVVHEQCETIYDDDGKSLHSLGLVQDITERVGSHNELLLEASAFRAHAGIIITEKDGTIMRVNLALEEMTGYSSAELVGQNPRILQSGKHSKEFYEDIWGSLKEKGMWQGELLNKRKDGTFYREWLTITAFKDDVGEVSHYVGTSQDISKVTDQVN